jgi:hypothetical protein
MAREWAKEGLRIFLMDLGLEEPSLHEALGLPNEEGVSDAFLFGASIQHIAKPALDNAVFFASAGAPPGDTEEVLGHPRWNDLAGGFSEAEATLLLFLPTEIPGAGKILSRATEILFLAARGESAEVHLGPASIKVVTTLGPLGTPPEQQTVPAEPSDPVSDYAGVEELDEDAEPEEDALLEFDQAVDSSVFDLEGGLELAEGFGFGAPEKGLLHAFEDPEPPLGREVARDERDLGGVGEGGVPGGGAASAEGGLEPGPGGGASQQDEGSPETGFGDDLVVGAGLTEEGADGSGKQSGEETVRSAAPDFDADFVDLPSVDESAPAKAPPGDFGTDLVQGPDFGVPVRFDQLGEAPPSPPQESRTGDRPAAAPGGFSKEVPPPPERRRPPRRKPPKRKMPWGAIGIVVLALAFLGSAVGTALGYVNVPGFTFLRSLFSEVPDPPLTLAGPEANEEVLRYSLVLFTYDQDEMTPALEMLDALQERLPDLLLTLVPGEADGRRTFTLLAGPAVDRVEAENLRGPIAEVLTREDPASWSVRETPRAFYLGERGTLREAQDYLASVTTEDIHAYILHVTFPEPEGSESYQVLTGAFAGVRDARPLQLILREVGFRDAPLIERRGRLPE